MTHDLCECQWETSSVIVGVKCLLLWFRIPKELNGFRLSRVSVRNWGRRTEVSPVRIRDTAWRRVKVLEVQSRIEGRKRVWEGGRVLWGCQGKRNKLRTSKKSRIRFTVKKSLRKRTLGVRYTRRSVCLILALLVGVRPHLYVDTRSSQT